MIFDEFGYPKVNGADDWADSPHLAGILALFDHPQQVDCAKYVVPGRYIRHPNEARYDMSRDQSILLMAGLWKQGKALLVNTDYIIGKDIIPPSVQGMVRKIKGKDYYFWQRWDFEAEFETNVTIQKLEEPFQVIAMCMVYGDGYLARWTRENNLWKWAIRRYLSELDGAWRGEKELAEYVIQKIEGMIK
jgi:hypothetical protein